MQLAALYTLLFSHATFMQWLKGHLLPCPFKYLTGLDCPGCGFQRAVIALLQGNLHGSLQVYPPAIPVILAFVYLIADKQLNLDNNQAVIKKFVYVAVSLVILVSYSLKMWHLYQHHNTSVWALR